jgi:hypothetical protein
MSVSFEFVLIGVERHIGMGIIEGLLGGDNYKGRRRAGVDVALFEDLSAGIGIVQP